MWQIRTYGAAVCFHCRTPTTLCHVHRASKRKRRRVEASHREALLYRACPFDSAASRTQPCANRETLGLQCGRGRRYARYQAPASPKQASTSSCHMSSQSIIVRRCHTCGEQQASLLDFPMHANNRQVIIPQAITYFVRSYSNTCFLLLCLLWQGTECQSCVAIRVKYEVVWWAIGYWSSQTRSSGTHALCSIACL